MNGYFAQAIGTDPCVNLAMEEYLVRLNEGLRSVILYLWQNEDTVVIGRNQNAYNECSLKYAEENGIRIVRRLTGGGAVFHDTGNINYSVITTASEHDITRSTQVIIVALQSLGIDAKASGRNDLCVGDKKISGNAYYTNDKVGLHHGTILYRVDQEKMEAVLSVAEDKLNRHGIRSVRSRVCDIVSIRPDISIGDIKEAITVSFMKVYGIEDLQDMSIPAGEIDKLADRYRSREWNLDKVVDAGSDEM